MFPKWALWPVDLLYIKCESCLYIINIYNIAIANACKKYSHLISFLLFYFSFFHTSTRRNDLMEFFDKKEDWEEDQVSCGKWCLNKLFMLKVSFNNSNLRNKIWGINLILKFFITFCIYLLINTVYKHCYIDWSKVNSTKRERSDCIYTGNYINFCHWEWGQ